MIIVVCGPTGIGKTKLSVELAKHYNGIVVNADSMQVYKGLDIGTAKVTEEEKCGIEHKLFDIVDVNDMYTVYDYQKDLRNILDNNKDKNIIIVGGTGLYIKAGLFNYVFDEETNNNNYDEYTNEELYKMVIEIDPDTDIHINNRKRLIRRLNIKNVSNDKDNMLYDAIIIGLNASRDVLYDRINKRVDIMINNGLLDEVKHFYDLGIKSKAIMTGIGYKELYDYFDGSISLEEAIELIKQRSRKYAKRQFTWFKNQMEVNWIDVDINNFNNTIKEAIELIDNKK